MQATHFCSGFRVAISPNLSLRCTEVASFKVTDSRIVHQALEI
jgi:hypothetical protein